MKSLLILVSLLSVRSAFSATECSLNPYALTKANLVVAYDWTEAKFDSRTGNKTQGEYFFNDLKDPSCVAVSVSNRDVVSCINVFGVKTDVGTLAKKEGRYTEWEFFSVNWSQSVVIKSELTERGCIYGLAI